MKFIALFALLLPTFVMGQTYEAATQAKWKVKGVRIYSNANCTGQALAYDADESDVSYQDFAASPTIMPAKAIGSGTYNCIALNLWDNISGVLSSSCTTETSIDICGDGSTSVHPDTDATTSCSNSSNEWHWIYLSTYKVVPTSGGFLSKPTSDSSATGAIAGLTSALTISSDKTSYFVADTSKAMDNQSRGTVCIGSSSECNNSDNCTMASPPLFGFR